MSGYEIGRMVVDYRIVSGTLTLVFWLSLVVIGYTYAGYPLLLRCLVPLRRGLRERQRRRIHDYEARSGKAGVSTIADTDGNGTKAWPDLTLVLVVYNEANRLRERIDNLAQCDYPGRRELVVVCNGCTDESATVARSWSGEAFPVTVIEQEGRLSKASGLNRGIAEAKGEILVFADARQQFNRHAIRKLVNRFSDETVVAVSGNLEIASSDEGAGAGIDAYWKLERTIRRLESEWDSVIGCTGAIYALRRGAFEPIPEDTILDDVVIPMRAQLAGGRVLFEAEALAYDPQNLAPDSERRRKIRTLAGNYQMLFRYPEWLMPWRNRTWWQVISHKYLRLAGPFFLLACLVSSGFLAWSSDFYRVVFFGQLVCYGLAFLGMSFRGIRSPLVTAPAGFVFLQWQGLRALFHYLRIRRSSEAGVWS